MRYGLGPRENLTRTSARSGLQCAVTAICASTDRVALCSATTEAGVDADTHLDPKLCAVHGVQEGHGNAGRVGHAAGLQHHVLRHLRPGKTPVTCRKPHQSDGASISPKITAQMAALSLGVGRLPGCPKQQPPLRVGVAELAAALGKKASQSSRPRPRTAAGEHEVHRGQDLHHPPGRAPVQIIDVEHDALQRRAHPTGGPAIAAGRGQGRQLGVEGAQVRQRTDSAADPRRELRPWAGPSLWFRKPNVRRSRYGRGMEMLSGDQITDADLSDWRKLGQGLHARFLVADFAAGARFVSAIAEAGDALGHHPRVTLGSGYVDLKLVSDDAVFRDEVGTEHTVEWVTQRDVDLARRVSEIAAEQVLRADPASITTIELALDTAEATRIAPMWAALLTGSTDAHCHGTIGDDIRDDTGRVPILWFQDTDEHETPRQRFHLDVWVAPEVADQRIAAAVAAGGTVVDDRQAPSYTVIADEDGNRACVCTSLSRA